ncbi:hypothetical protein F5Y18DRAFT_241695 [Xylariaceae sp. FL1019]|nr:hypothetical protein F5Y18DRAFT_241695 [Xylariaceae sp. FL1019]
MLMPLLIGIARCLHARGVVRVVVVRVMVIVVLVCVAMLVIVIVMMVMVVVVMRVWRRVVLALSLAAPVLLLEREAKRLGLPLLLVPGAEALAAEHEVVVVDDYGLRPAVALQLLLGDVDAGQVVVLRLIRGGVRGCRSGHHFQRRGTVSLRGRRGSMARVLLRVGPSGRDVGGCVVAVGWRTGRGRYGEMGPWRSRSFGVGVSGMVVRNTRVGARHLYPYGRRDGRMGNMGVCRRYLGCANAVAGGLVAVSRCRGASRGVRRARVRRRCVDLGWKGGWTHVWWDENGCC